jgi:ADP-ribose pyrophosphatase YjhB (NUDIX family)
MVKVIQGERVGKQGQIRVGCSAVIFDATRQKVLLTRRDDNGRWCLPSGLMEAGESAAETCAREVLEETGLQVRVGRLVGIYSSPHILLVYQTGNRIQPINLCFEAEAIGGELGLSDETTEVGYFSLDEIAMMDLMENHQERIKDAFSAQTAAIVK